MQKLISSKHLEGVSDLTLSAPIKQGFIDAFETITYESRLRAIMKALFRVRSTAREHSTIKPFVDTAERIQALLDFRLAIHGDELLLSATFDRPFEPYMRLIWDPLGPLLDVIFCNCEGYVTATEHCFDDYLGWVRRSQIDTNFFYAASGHSVNDIQYLTQIEKLQREAEKRYRPSAVTVESPMKAAAEIRNSRIDELRKESCQLGMEALVALYKLTDLYPPDRPDGRYLLWATQQLLEKWGNDQLQEFRWQGLVADQLAWLAGEPAPEKRTPGNRLTFRRANIQGGILANYGTAQEPVRQAALLLTRITDPVRARAFLKQLTSPPAKTAEGSKAPEAKDIVARLRVQAEREEGAATEGDTFLNLAFTRLGLLNIGLPEADYDRLPQEFREGMEERAGLLGDVRDNHPRRWKLPQRYRAPAPDGEALPKADLADTPVELTEVDLVLVLRTLEGEDGSIGRIAQALASTPECGLALLAVEPMRPAPKRENTPGTDHFGFRDGISQPRPVVSPDPDKADEVPLGEIFLGYSNARADGPSAPSAILDDGTFLVLRKLSQNVGGLRTFVRTETGRLNEEVRKEVRQAGAAKGLPGQERTVFITEEDLYAKMMGRDRDGRVSLEKPKEGNKFDYRSDPQGTSCPFQSHIRRANPRSDPADTDGRPTPRILRRGHSYGPGYDGCGEAEKAAERGVFFMAYNASLSEQYEVIQRWINGGNSTKVASWQSDPLMGVGQHGDPRTFRFLHKGRTCRVNIPDPFVKLRWGAYLFVPSISALRAIGVSKPDVRTAGEGEELEQARRGEPIVSRLLALAAGGPEGRIAAGAAWKGYLEDFAAKDPGEKDEATAVWAAIRIYHAGALKVPYGVVPPRETPRDAVLVASKELVMRVFADPGCKYSMSGQMTRMKQSFGEIFLGMDKGPLYAAKSKVNEILFAITEREAFELARKCAMTALAVSFRVKDEVDVQQCKIDLRRHFITAALAGVCHAWFGIPDAPPPASPRPDNFVDPWGWSWEPAETRKPRCPGDYMATSRFCFYPDPIPRVRAFGKSHGQALRKAVRGYFDKVRGTPALSASLSRAMAELRLPDGELAYPDNDDLARNVIGVMTGFLPPADGCMRWALYEWLEDKTLPRVQHDLTSASGDAFARADKALRPWLERAMQKRPAPDLLWRTATRDHRIGEVDVAADDRVFIGIVSALAEDAAAGITDVYPIFGGERGRPDSPLHACPAHKAAMGTMLGILSALLDNFRIESLPATMLVAISEPSKPMCGLIGSEKIGKTAAMILAATATPVAPPAEDAADGYGKAGAVPAATVSGRGDPAGEERKERADLPVDVPAK